MNERIYTINVLVCISIIIFCGVKVILDPRPETTSIYLPVASGIAGYFVPSPKIDKKDKKENENDNESLVSRLSKRLLIGGNKKNETQPEQVVSSNNSQSDVLDV